MSASAFITSRGLSLSYNKLKEGSNKKNNIVAGIIVHINSKNLLCVVPSNFLGSKTLSAVVLQK
jgi:hypothetical protein